MSLNDVIHWVSDVVRQHEGWAIPIIFFLAFGESLAFLSLLLPATVILLALGALIGESGIAFWPIWAAAAAGAFFGDWLSYWVGYHYQDRVAHMWPLSRNPQLLVRGHAFFERWACWAFSSAVFSARCGRWCRWSAASAPCRSAISNWLT
ncbi:Inner membrane protein yabI [Serratia rubidaea]|uniref:Inner membrane protein yabI n=1 Tax=Serratia rubidaea TaxID=61652 RepID=A0A4V6JGE2_SERRU|nr:Inner membrane protein yabI [Serratia rubidaea]